MTTTRAVTPEPAEAEQSVLGAILLDPEALGLIAHLGLKASHFHHRRHAVIWSAINYLDGKHEPIDIVTVDARLTDAGHGDDSGGLRYLNQLMQSALSAANIARYANIVLDRASLRALSHAADQISDILKDPVGAAAEKVDRVMSLFEPIQRSGSRPEARHIGELVIERTGHWDGLARGEVESGTTTGLTVLDKHLGGGFKGGKFIVLAARPSVGKTSLAIQLAIASASAGSATLILSQEMPAADLADRIVANLGRVNMSALVAGKLEDDDWARISSAAEIAANLPLHIDEQPGLTLQQIKSKARQRKSRFGLNLLVVDYLQLCAGASSRDNRNTQIEEISRGLKVLAKELDITVLALAQLNRASIQRDEPDLADLRDSGAIEQDADTVIFLHPKAELGDSVQLIAAILAKNRQGRRGRIALEFHGATQRWLPSEADVLPEAKIRR